MNGQGLACLFLAIAAVPRRFVYHKDWTDGSWNVFEVVDGEENFVGNHKLLESAQDFCSINNGILESIGGNDATAD